uniref:(California timema) hypothetical protein n=1 Tax=Timema californicum TaxID=61474 RepID=A0A7R9JBK8_TIMCA|nr:unnamed protein product [Timema californicum]
MERSRFESRERGKPFRKNHPPVHPTKIRTSISPSSAVELNNDKRLANARVVFSSTAEDGVIEVRISVGDDMEMMLNKIVPEGLPYRHSCEGPDDMPAHVKACFLGSSLTIPITDGKLNLGTWQGIWLCEHRDHAGSRKVVITINGCLRDSSRSPMSPVSPMASTSS